MTINDALGSSPLTRGKLKLTTHYQPANRLIPAHAGKTPGRSSSLPCCWAHPRSRGENPRPSSRASCSMGSSPLTRGKRIYRRPRTRTRRLIPAHAGKTALTTSSGPSFRAHPRSRGENLFDKTHVTSRRGSSPLTRGKRVCVNRDRAVLGLIPAHAGKTFLVVRGGDTAPAHPRSRGENPTRLTAVEADRGSSPLTRGKRCESANRRCASGLIPAHAGKTPPPLVRVIQGEAHPRSRGENSVSSGLPGTIWGSSPLTRGKLCPVVPDDAQPGLIPAHAGKTRQGAGLPRRWPAHPRSRGENR